MPETFLSIDALLERMVARSASDLHVTVGTPPAMRVNGALERYQDVPDLSPEDTHQMLYRILSTEQQKVLEINRQIDFAHSIPGLARFRVNVFFQRGTLGAAFRLIPADIKTLEELGIPTALHALTEKPRGLVLVTGPTGSGKSTTLAALIDEINRKRSEHILTIEDPVEFVHRHKRCIVNQREIGPDASSFAEALRAALREDPDVILLEVRVQLAVTLQGICTQALLPTQGGTGRVPALEILFPDDAVRNLIRQGKVEQVYSVMQTGTAKGMRTMEQSLADLVIRKVITLEDALSRSSRPEQLFGLLERAGVVTSSEGVGSARAPLSGTLRVAEA